MEKRFKAAIIGSGSRGSNFGVLMQKLGGKFEISAICDISKEQLEKSKRLMNLTDDILFDNEEEFFKEKRGDVIVIATPDTLHVRQCICAMKLGYSVLLEKPISGSREEIKYLLETQKETDALVAICHELRYGPAFEKLSELIEKGCVGDVLVIDAFERLSWWHQAQAYVRLQSENDLTFATILAKCSHDLDLIQHYAGAECDTVSSIGDLSFFRKENAPSGAAERCLECSYVDLCSYSAKKIYIEGFNKDGCPEWSWPYNKVSLIKPNREVDLYDGLGKKCFGKCAFKCGVERDRHVVDHQLVQMQFKNGVMASLKMVFSGHAGRRYNIFGTHGEILLDERRGVIEILRYGEDKKIIEFGSLTEAGQSHGGGDERLICNLYKILSDSSLNRTSLSESVESHLMGIAAEESRLAGGVRVEVHK